MTTLHPPDTGIRRFDPEKTTETDNRLAILSAAFGFDITQNCRQGKYVEARMIFCAMCSAKYMSLPKIAKMIKRNHATVYNALNRFCDLYQTEIQFREKVIRYLPNTEAAEVILWVRRYIERNVKRPIRKAGKRKKAI